MSFAFMPFYTGDYLRDTADLTLTEHGIYMRLLMYCWDSRGPVPPDEARAARIVNASSDDERMAVKGILTRYFVRHDDGWYNPRMEREIAHANAISNVRSEAGRRGGANSRQAILRAQQAIATANAQASATAKAQASDATPTPTTTTTTTTTPIATPELPVPMATSVTSGASKTKAPPRARGQRLKDDWKLPKEWSDWTVTEFKWPPDRVRAVAATFADFWHAKAGANACKLDWQATWRIWCRRDNATNPQTPPAVRSTKVAL